MVLIYYNEELWVIGIHEVLSSGLLRALTLFHVTGFLAILYWFQGLNWKTSPLMALLEMVIILFQG